MWTTGGVLTAALLLVLLLGCVLYLWFHWTHRHILKAAAQIPPFLPNWPLLGTSYIVLNGTVEMTRLLIHTSCEMVCQGIKTAVFWCGPLPLLMVHDIDDIQKVLNSSNTSEKGNEYAFISGFMQAKGHYHLLNAPNNKWKKMRRHTNPLFHPRNLEHMQSVFNHNSRLLVECLDEHVGRGTFDLYHYIMDTGLLTICNLMFGPEVYINWKSTEFKNLKKFVETIPDLLVKRILRPWLRVDAVFDFLYRNELKELDSCWREFTERCLQVSKDYRARKGFKEECSIKNPANVRQGQEEVEGQMTIVDVYTVLQHNYPEFSAPDLITDVGGFLCTGTDTMGASVSACLLALAQYQDIQEHLYQEISSVVKEDEDITLEDLNQMPYLDQVIKETLRWSMVVPYLLRKPSEDIELSTCKVSAGSTIIVALVGIHMDPKLYPDPTKFDPDRFSTQESSKRDRFAYVPFSGGPRNCVAKTYAMQLIKTMVVHVLKNFKIFTKMDMHKLNRRMVITLVSQDGYLVTLEKR